MSHKYTVFHLDDGKELRGGERQALRLAKELKRLGHRNIMVCRRDSPVQQEASAAGIEILNLPYLFEWDPVSAFILRGKADSLPEGSEIVFHAHTGHTPAAALQAALGLKCLRIAHRRVNFRTPKASVVMPAIQSLLADNISSTPASGPFFPEG